MPIENGPVRVLDLEWRERERDRFRSGEYRHCPWESQEWWYRDDIK